MPLCYCNTSPTGQSTRLCTYSQFLAFSKFVSIFELNIEAAVAREVERVVYQLEGPTSSSPHAFGKDTESLTHASESECMWDS